MDTSKEYLMLRDEIIHLDGLENTTINFSYAFVAAILSFALTVGDNIFILLAYVGVFPAYKITLAKAQQIYQITAYLYVFHEQDNGFNWEHRRHVYVKNERKKPKRRGKFHIKMRSYHWPYLVDTLVITVMFFARNKLNLCDGWDCVDLYEGIKMVVAIACAGIIVALFLRYKHSETIDYIDRWQAIKDREVIDNDDVICAVGASTKS